MRTRCFCRGAPTGKAYACQAHQDPPRPSGRQLRNENCPRWGIRARPDPEHDPCGVGAPSVSLPREGAHPHCPCPRCAPRSAPELPESRPRSSGGLAGPLDLVSAQWRFVANNSQGFAALGADRSTTGEDSSASDGDARLSGSDTIICANSVAPRPGRHPTSPRLGDAKAQVARDICRGKPGGNSGRCGQ